MSGREREIKELIASAVKLGCTARKRRNNHWVLTTPNGDKVYLPYSPSDHRAFLNARGNIRRAGVPL